VVVLHLVREWLRGRYAHWHRFAWLTGVAALVMAYCAGLTGFWLVWDRLAQYSLRATMEWLDALPVFGELGRNFIVNAAVTDRLFSLLVFVHIGVPLALLAGLWLHVQRLARPGTQPPRILAWLTLAALVVLALIAPVQSQGPADLAASPTTLQVDWFYLGMHAVADRTSQAALWTMAIAGLLVVSLLPWRGRAARVARAPAAVVDEAHCNGCGRCAADCPYAAITITRPVSEGGVHDAPPRAVVAAELGAACGICAGACPSSTPFRSADLLTGIDLPHRRIAAVRADVDEILARWRGRTHAAAPILVLGCEGTVHADLQQLGGSGVVGLELVCAGQLPPSFIPYALRTGARGVVVSACVDCTYRLGELWTAQRLQGRREPRLRDGVLEYVREVCRAPGDVRQLAAALASLRAELESHGSAVAGLPPKRIVDEDAHVA